jgi:hypothetical protein
MRAEIGIETAFAIDAVECTELAIGRKKVDAQGNAQSTAMYRSEDRRGINNCCHNFFTLHAKIGIKSDFTPILSLFLESLSIIYS